MKSINLYEKALNNPTAPKVFAMAIVATALGLPILSMVHNDNIDKKRKAAFAISGFSHAIENQIDEDVEKSVYRISIVQPGTVFSKTTELANFSFISYSDKLQTLADKFNSLAVRSTLPPNSTIGIRIIECDAANNEKTPIELTLKSLTKSEQEILKKQKNKSLEK